MIGEGFWVCGWLCSGSMDVLVYYFLIYGAVHVLIRESLWFQESELRIFKS